MPKSPKVISAIVDGLRRMPDLWRADEHTANGVASLSAADGAKTDPPKEGPRRRSIRWKILVAFVCMAAITFFLGAYAVIKITDMSRLVAETYDRPLMMINFTRKALNDFSLMDGRLGRQALAMAKNASIAARNRLEMQRSTEIFFDDLEATRQRSVTEEALALIAEIEVLVRVWTEKRQIAYNQGLTPERWQEMDNISVQVTQRFDQLIEIAARDGFDQRQKATDAIQDSRRTAAIMTVLALIASAAVTIALAGVITRPLSIAAAAAGRIADGDMDAEIPEGADEETGILLNTMRVMQQNIREMMQREVAQRKSAQTRLIEAIEKSSEAVVLLDVDNRILIANSQIQDFFPNCADVELAGMPFDEFRALIADPEISHGKTNGKGLNGRRPTEQRLPDGRWVRSSGSPTQDGGAIMFWTDITALKRREGTLRAAKKQAEAASEAKTAFLTNMSHELRTPLNAIIGFSEVIATEIFGPIGQPRYKDYANDVLRSSHHLLDVINDILDISKNEASKLQVKHETVVLAKVIDDSLHIVRDWFERSDVRISVDTPDPKLKVGGDAARLRQVLLNILSNAVKFTDSGGTVTVSAQRSAGKAVIEISDTGIGMHAKDIPTAMSMFGQIDSTLARKYEGTGLGIPLSKAIIELHKGSLDIASTIGQGTVVTITLPLAPSKALARGKGKTNGLGRVKAKQGAEKTIAAE